jgi:hypothetical protein
MKISKSKLIQMIKEEMMNEDDEFIPPEELEPQSTGMTLKSDVDLEALKQILLDARGAYDPGEPDSVYSVVRGVERALELLEESVQLTTPTGASHRRMRGQQRTTGAKLSPDARADFI